MAAKTPKPKKFKLKGSDKPKSSGRRKLTASQTASISSQGGFGGSGGRRMTAADIPD